MVILWYQVVWIHNQTEVVQSRGNISDINPLAVQIGIVQIATVHTYTLFISAAIAKQYTQTEEISWAKVLVDR